MSKKEYRTEGPDFFFFFFKSLCNAGVPIPVHFSNPEIRQAQEKNGKDLGIEGFFGCVNRGRIIFTRLTQLNVYIVCKIDIPGGT